MTPEQSAFLQSIALKIPKLFAAIADRNVRAEYILGQRVIRGHQVRLKLVAEVVDPGENPLSTHSTCEETKAKNGDINNGDLKNEDLKYGDEKTGGQMQDARLKSTRLKSASLKDGRADDAGPEKSVSEIPGPAKL